MTCGLAMLEKRRLSGDWSSLIRVQGKGPGGLANECNCPMSEQPFLNRYEGLDLPPIQYSTDLRAKRAKATFCLKIRSAFDKLYFGILWPKELEGLD